MTGSVFNPLTLEQSASDARIQPNSVAYLRGGAYTFSGTITFTRNGVEYKPYRTEKPVLQPSTGNLTINSSGATFTNLEISGVNPNRISVQSESAPTDIDFYRVLALNHHVTFRGCIIHDITELNVDHAAHTFVLIDCILYNCGWIAPDRGHGHLCYIQNDGLGVHIISNCIFGQSFAYGMHCYGVNAKLIGIHVDRLIQFNPRFVMGGEVGSIIDDIVLTNSVLWNIDNARFGERSGTAGSLTLTNNYYALSTPNVAANWSNVVNTGNVSATGGTNAVRVFTCGTAPKIAHVAVMNWQQLDSVNVTVDGLQVGHTYMLRNAYNPIADTRTFVYEGGDVPLNMLDRSVAVPFGYSSALAELDKRFGAWSIEEVL